MMTNPIPARPFSWKQPCKLPCILLTAGMLLGCQAPNPPPIQDALPSSVKATAVKPVAEPVAQHPPAANGESQVRALLEQANRAYRYDHLTGPQPGNALDLYRQVLALDPYNEEALRGPERITERFVALALEAAGRWQFVQARGYVARARSVLPGHPSIAPTEAQIGMLANAERKSRRFVRDGLNDGNDETVGQLVALGTEAKQGSCRTTIIAPGDAEGRWMFQKMNEGPGDGRVRANVQIGSPPGVELVCFPDGQ